MISRFSSSLFRISSRVIVAPCLSTYQDRLRKAGRLVEKALPIFVRTSGVANAPHPYPTHTTFQSPKPEYPDSMLRRCRTSHSPISDTGLWLQFSVKRQTPRTF